MFSAGVKGNIEKGGDQSRAVDRRDARSHRRLLDRHRRRLFKLAHLLQGAKIFPPEEITTPQQLHTCITQLDQQIFPPEIAKESPHLLLYRLRTKALDHPLTPYALGRALYHLAQRRGFLSNRKSTPKKDEKPGEINKEIEGLSAEIRNAGYRTLGEYFSKLDPTDARIRTRHTSRKMYEEEFEALWLAQAPHHPTILTDALKKKLHRAIFFQRPLKSAKHLIGLCELEPKRKRAPIALLIVQRFRLLQKVNDLEITNTHTGELRPLTPEKRTKLIDLLDTDGDQRFANIRKLLLLKSYTFNLERVGEKMIGNRTAKKLRDIFGARWDGMGSEERDRLVEDVRSIQKDKTLERRGKGYWKLSDEAAKRLSQISLEDGHCALSLHALKKLLPLMAQGTAYATARKEVYGELPKPEAVSILPSLENAPISEIRNPMVTRTLSEMRKVVNAIIQQYGRPAEIRIELARDMKKGREDRKEIWKKNEKNRKMREEAAKKILNEVGIQNPSRSDKERWILYEECNRTCPYTGRSISAQALFGSDIDVEHIIPFSKCLDDSFMNKTLCYAEENRNRKTNQTPWEAYGSSDKWDDILHRVKSFYGDTKHEKLRRFKLETEEVAKEFEGFKSRQLNDTRYATRLAVQYLNLLYGGGTDGVGSNGKRHIVPGRGQITAFVRNEYKLNTLLGDGGEKTRADHRHHAVDAIAIALTDANMVKRLSDAAKDARTYRRRRFAPLPPLWSTFLEDAQTTIDQIHVSHRPSHKVNGQIHEETIYSKPHTHGKQEYVHVRKPLHNLSKTESQSIVDPAIQNIVQEALNGRDPKTVFAEPKNHPYLTTRDGRKIPIHSVRIRKGEAKSTITLGQGMNQRRVMTGNNHHIEIIETKEARGRLKWEGKLITLYEAMKRLRMKQPVVCRDVQEGERFIFSLCGGDIIELDKANQPSVRELFVVRTLSHVNKYLSVAFVRLNDARDTTKIPKRPPDWTSLLLDPLRKRHCRKVTITPLGAVRYAND